MLSEQARARLRLRLEKHEGIRLHPYRCTEGKLTIGIGRNLDDKGISLKEAQYLLDNDLAQAAADARAFFCWTQMNEPRKTVFVEMVFQLGKVGVLRFKKFLLAAGKADWDAAADEMLDSKWAKQTPSRANALALIMRRGVYEW